MRFRDEFPYEVIEVPHEWIPLFDGTRLSARVWRPVGSDRRPVPAVLEYLPYRKDDATEAADARQHPYFAGHGYASVRVDIRGSGSSDGLLRGEYLPSEQDDAVEVLSWLGSQPWCTGAVGMIGYSWGGFNALQVAARRPPELKAVITHASTDDRYLDDCHYMGGCMLASDMLKWSSTMLAYALMPPDPRFVGERWREQWLERLRCAPPLASDWVSHQRDGAFWRQGSVADDYSAIACPVLAVGGWADAYTNAVPRLLEHLMVPRRGLIGPWGHMMPQTGVPGPAIGFLQEALRWWDQWLRGMDTGIMTEPMCRAWMQEYAEPAAYYAERPGRWVALEEWPPLECETRRLVLARPDMLLPASDQRAPDEDRGAATVRGVQECGECAGVWCANGNPDELPVDQGPDDARSACFAFGPLDEDLEVLGVPEVVLRLSCDRTGGLVSARLEDVHPDGHSLLVSWGMLNLTHREGHAVPGPLVPGQDFEVVVPLRVCGHRFRAGHRIRLALSPTYWPHAWPARENVSLELSLRDSSIRLPEVRRPLRLVAEPAFGPAEVAGRAGGGCAPHDERTRERRFDERTRVHEIVDRESHSRTILATDARLEERATDVYRIAEGDPLSAEVRCMRETTSAGPERSWTIRVSAEMTCDESHFFVRERYEADEDGSVLFTAERSHAIVRDHV